MNRKENKKDDQQAQQGIEPRAGKGTRSLKSPGNVAQPASPTSPSLGKRRHLRRGRKVKFADPIYKQLLYEKAVHDMDQIGPTITPNSNRNRSTLNDLEPPLSLVAHLDLAARKLDARKTAKSTDEVTDKTNHEKSLKSIPADKDNKSADSPGNKKY